MSETQIPQYVVKKESVLKYSIKPQNGDTITVIIDEANPRWRTITITTFDKTYHDGWNACGDCLRKFLLRCNSGYLANNLKIEEKNIDIEKTRSKLGRIAYEVASNTPEYRILSKDIEHVDGETLVEIACSIRGLDLFKRLDLDEGDDFWYGDIVQYSEAGEFNYFFGHIWPVICDVFKKELERKI